jgi:hypothetical protein
VCRWPTLSYERPLSCHHFICSNVSVGRTQPVEALGGGLGELARLGFERLRRLILRFMLLARSEPPGAQCNEGEDGHDRRDGGKHAKR